MKLEMRNTCSFQCHLLWLLLYINTLRWLSWIGSEQWKICQFWTHFVTITWYTMMYTFCKWQDVHTKYLNFFLKKWLPWQPVSFLYIQMTTVQKRIWWRPDSFFSFELLYVYRFYNTKHGKIRRWIQTKDEPP